MAITATNEGQKNFEPTPAGNHIARAIRMFHIGTIDDTYMGEAKTMNKVLITWELPMVRKIFDETKGEQPCVIGKEFTLSMGDKATLRKFFESWRGRKYSDDEAKAVQIDRVLGQPCLLNVIHKVTKKGHTVAEITNISPLPQGFNCPQQENPVFVFDYDPFDIKKFYECPKWIQDKISTSKEFKALNPNGVPPNPNAQPQAQTNAPVSQTTVTQQPVNPVMQTGGIQVAQQQPIQNVANTVVEDSSLPF